MSIVIPTFNRRDRLERVLRAVADQTFPLSDLEVVVVSDGSTDGTNQLARTINLPYRLVFEEQANSGPAAARNRGIDLATGTLVLFIDDDVVPAPILVEQHVASHAPDGSTVVIGPMLTPTDARLQPWVRWEQAMLEKQYAALDAGVYAATARQFYTGNASVARARLLEVGGFDVRYRRAEDVELSHRLHRAGLRFVWNARAAGYHYAERSFESWLRTAHDYGAHEVDFGQAHGQDPCLQRVHDEFRGRTTLVRSTTRACVACPPLARALVPAMRETALLADRLRLDRVAQQALSGAYNVTFYVALAEALGGRVEFERIVVGPPRRAVPT